jgi:hypothetical protein
MTKSIFEASTYNTESNQIKLGYFEKLPIFIHEKDFRTMTLNEADYEKRRTRYEARNNFMTIIDQLTTKRKILNAFKREHVLD